MTKSYLAWMGALALLAAACGAPGGEKKQADPPPKRGWLDCKDSPEKHPGPWRPIKDDEEQAKLRKELAGKGRIVFCSNRDGNWEIYACDADGGNQVNLTKNSAWDFYPRWSPDGKRVIFHSDRDSKVKVAGRVSQQMELEMTWTAPAHWQPQHWGIYVGTEVGVYSMNPDGSDVKLLVSPGSNGCLSPDGKWLAYEHQDTVWLKNLETGEIKLGTPPYWGGAWEPSFSPDGKSLLCMTGHDSGYSPTIFPLGPDGLPTGKYLVLCKGGEGCHPRWAPDGRRIIYCQDTRGAILRWVSLDEKGEGPDGFRKGADIDMGGEYKDKYIAAYPAVSPDGRYIIFSQSPVYFEHKPKLEPMGYKQWSFGRQIIWQELCVMRAEGKVFIQLTDGGYANRDPDWTAAGR